MGDLDGDGGDVAAGPVGLGLDCEEGAVFDLAGAVGAGVYGFLQEIVVPAHHEICVVSVTCGSLVAEGEGVGR